MPPGATMHTCNLSTLDVEAGLLLVECAQGQPEPQSHLLSEKANKQHTVVTTSYKMFQLRTQTSQTNKSLAFGSQPVLESSSETSGDKIVSSTWRRRKVGIFPEQVMWSM